MKYYIALDIGGTNIKSAIVSTNGCVWNSQIKEDSSLSKESSKIILNNFCNIIEQQITIAIKNNIKIYGIGLGFPGPFDYEKGTSLMKGINKYDSIYGINLREEFSNRLKNSFEYKFLNDADLYCLGEGVFEKGKKYKKSICLCIGTGIGSGFLENGKLIKYREDVPLEGWVYNCPYKDGIADDYLSARGILNIAKNKASLESLKNVKTLAEKAFLGDNEAQLVFYEFGENLGEFLLPFVKKFAPEAIIIGGQIAKSFELFQHGLIKGLRNEKVVIEFSSNSTKAALIAVPYIFK